jgi:adenine-specific DNA-methyltransferase
MGYRFPPDTMKKMLDKGKILFGDDDNKIIEIKLYADEFEDKLSSLIVLDGRLGSYNLRELFPNIKKIFDNPKPIDLLTQLFNFVLYEEDIVLDFFGGSCATPPMPSSTATRKMAAIVSFIMVQLPEPCAPDS